MKNLAVIAFAMTLSSAAFAGQPNLFSCKTADAKVQISYTTSSFQGQPTFGFEINRASMIVGPNQTVDLKQESIPYGTLVTAIVTRNLITDVPSQAYSLVVPFFSGKSGANSNQPIKFSTLAMRGSVGGMRGPGMVTSTISETYKVQCTASSVLF